jgi:hypothetical protein
VRRFAPYDRTDRKWVPRSPDSDIRRLGWYDKTCQGTTKVRCMQPYTDDAAAVALPIAPTAPRSSPASESVEACADAGKEGTVLAIPERWLYGAITALS